MMKPSTRTVSVATLKSDQNKKGSIGYVVVDFRPLTQEVRVQGIVTDFWLPLSAVGSVDVKEVMG